MNLTNEIPTLKNLPPEQQADEIYETFTKWVKQKDITLYPAQEEAILEIVLGSNIIMATPTGSGKSLVAIAAHFAAITSQKHKTYYTAPIKALVSEKFFALCEIFKAENVGMITGDSSVNPQAQIICCTAEILANIALREGKEAEISQIIMDEFHFYSDPQRGWAWQVPLIEIPQAQFILMSATLGDVKFFEKELTKTTNRKTQTVSTNTRPVPLHYYFQTTQLQETTKELLETHQAPIYIVHFSQAEATEQAQNLMSIKICTRSERDKIAQALGNFKFTSGFGKTLSRLIRHGIGVHHAGMLPKYRRLVEQLTQSSLLKIICGTDTLGVGINVPIRTVLFTALSKFDGNKNRILNAREFHQIAGRAGRAGFDAAGTVVVQAPEHTIENLTAIKKAGEDPKKIRKIVRKKPPAGFVSWAEPTFNKLVNSTPEPLTSSFTITHAMLINLLQRPGNTFEHARNLLKNNHESETNKRKLILKALEIYRSLLNAEVIKRSVEPDIFGSTVHLSVKLPENFALNQPLATFALASLELLDPESETYALDIISIIESILENPKQILKAQEEKEKRELLAQLKLEGVPFEQRMVLLDQTSYPQPLAELLFGAFDIYAKGAPWVKDYTLTPKAIVRNLWENAMNFGQFVQFYGLIKSEGLVLRYFSNAYKTLKNTLPTKVSNTELNNFIDWLGILIKSVDSSLLDEWEQLVNPNKKFETLPEINFEQKSLDTKAIKILVRNEMFHRVKLLAQENYKELGLLDETSAWNSQRWEEIFKEYWEEHDYLEVGAQARGPQFFILKEEKQLWTVEQILLDPLENCDWRITAKIDLADLHEDGMPKIQILNFKKL